MRFRFADFLEDAQVVNIGEEITPGEGGNWLGGELGDRDAELVDFGGEGDGWLGLGGWVLELLRFYGWRGAPASYRWWGSFVFVV